MARKKAKQRKREKKNQEEEQNLYEEAADFIFKKIKDECGKLILKIKSIKVMN